MLAATTTTTETPTAVPTGTTTTIVVVVVVEIRTPAAAILPIVLTTPANIAGPTAPALTLVPNATRRPLGTIRKPLSRI